VADDVVKAVALFEKNHLRDHIGESAVEADELLARADARLALQARDSWRWRLLRIRAAIDHELYRNQRGEGREEVFRKSYEELVTILHAENARSMLRPVPIQAVHKP